ncbi:MAG: cell division protein DivIVA [Haloechinothrix sp.]
MTSPRPKRDNALPRVPREFDHMWNGYDRNQVREHLDMIQADVRRLIAERDSALSQLNALSQQLESARAENGTLSERVEELSVPPKDLDDLDQRMQRVGHIAYLKADEITARAQTAAEENWKSTAQASIALRERYRSLLSELDAHAEAMHAEHRAALEETRAEVQQLTVDAVRRRDRLDAEAERKRRAIEQEFDAHMAAERGALDKYIADQQTASKNHAQRRIAEATTEAQRRIAEATKDANSRTAEANTIIDRLAEIGADVRSRLSSADELLANSQAALEPLENELLPVPRVEEAVPADGNGEAPSEADNAAAGNGARGNGPARAAHKPSPRPHAEVGAGPESASRDKGR